MIFRNVCEKRIDVTSCKQIAHIRMRALEIDRAGATTGGCHYDTSLTPGVSIWRYIAGENQVPIEILIRGRLGRISPYVSSNLGFILRRPEEIVRIVDKHTDRKESGHIER